MHPPRIPGFPGENRRDVITKVGNVEARSSQTSWIIVFAALASPHPIVTKKRRLLKVLKTGHLASPPSASVVIYERGREDPGCDVTILISESRQKGTVSTGLMDWCAVGTISLGAMDVVKGHYTTPD